MSSHDTVFCRYFCSLTRHQGNWVPLYKKGEHTIKQPVYVSDVAKGVIKAMELPDAMGQTYQAVGWVCCCCVLASN